MRNPAIYLIGTGPGDPGLITVHGLECIKRADVVIHDHEVPQRVLKKARRGAELIDVGKGGRQPMEQDAITFLLAEKARDGKLVARLKRGDPFVFDRGGEEALFLNAQGNRKNRWTILINHLLLNLTMILYLMPGARCW